MFTDEELRLLLTAGIQFPLVLVFIIFTLILLHFFLRYLETQEARRVEAAVAREKERNEKIEAQNTSWQKYLAESRDAYLKALTQQSLISTEDAKATTAALEGLTRAVTAQTETLTRHDAMTVEMLRGIGQAINNSNGSKKVRA